MVSDVQKLALDVDKFTFPCLAHVINLIAKRIVLLFERDEGDNEGEPELDKIGEEIGNCSKPHRYRWFFTLGVFRPQGSHVLPQWI